MPGALERFCQLVTEANQHINLVSRKDIGKLSDHHVKPSLLWLEWERVKPGERVLDIGSGGGFPGMVIAIMEPTIDMTLVESIGKKAKFLQNCVQQLHLKNVHVIHDRVEHLTGQYDRVTARAVAPLEQLWEWAEPLLKDGGTLEAMKGSDAGTVIVSRTKHATIAR